MWPGVCHDTLHFPAESPAFIDYFLAGFVFKVCYNVSVFDWSKQTVIVRIFGAFLWSGKSLKECSLSGLYCLYLEGKTDKEGLDHCFSMNPLRNQSTFVEVRAQTFRQQRERELYVIPADPRSESMAGSGMRWPTVLGPGLRACRRLDT